jgi:hypothetical protein
LRSTFDIDLQGGPMARLQQRRLHSIEGRQVSIALRDGTRLDDCNLVSGGRNRIDNLWLFANGEDVFVALEDVAEVWETDTDHPRAA